MFPVRRLRCRIPGPLRCLQTTECKKKRFKPFFLRFRNNISGKPPYMVVRDMNLQHMGEPMNRVVLFLAAWCACWQAVQSKPVVPPFESAVAFTARNRIDAFVLRKLRDAKIAPAPRCSDEVFCRRVYLDVTGTIPTPGQVRAFLADRRPRKREALIERLLKSSQFADYWSMRWSDVLRVKSEYPVNLWPNGVQAYHRWIHTALRDNVPYDQFARELLTASGSNFRVPPVNFYRAMQGKSPATIAQSVALTFMGTRLDTWPEDVRSGLEALFSRVAFKGTAEWKEEIVFPDPKNTEPLTALLPDGTTASVDAGQDPRTVFADWLISPDNRWFTGTVVNRIWFWLMGRGIIAEPDNIRPDSPVSHPRLLAYLEEELVTARFDLRHIYRLILNSSTYQQSPIPRCSEADATHYFACYPVRQLDAEVLIDALCDITGTQEQYSSPIPEPFTFVPENQTSVMLADGSISSPFLELFGRPARDTGLLEERNNTPNRAQRLRLLNSSHIQMKIEGGPRLRLIAQASRGNRQRLITLLYMNILSRRPTASERKAAAEYLDRAGMAQTQKMHDLVWALINTKEFLYRH